MEAVAVQPAQAGFFIPGSSTELFLSPKARAALGRNPTVSLSAVLAAHEVDGVLTPEGKRVLSTFPLPDGTRFWILTEDGVTQLMLSEEYLMDWRTGYRDGQTDAGLGRDQRPKERYPREYASGYRIGWTDLIFGGKRDLASA